jgi:NTE family protein
MVETSPEIKSKQENTANERKKVAVACQGGGMHAAFAVGVLNEILKKVKDEKFELVGLSGTSAGALVALMVWYGLAPKNGAIGSEDEARGLLKEFWKNFVANTPAEAVLNFFTYGTFIAEEAEIPWLGINAPLLGGTFNPYGAIYKAIADGLPRLGVRPEYFNLRKLLKHYCPKFKDVNWDRVKTRLLIGASEVVNGFETVFDSGVNSKLVPENEGMKDRENYWRQQLPLSLEGVAASGTLPIFRRAQKVTDEEVDYYWDGLYSHNPPVRDFVRIDKKDYKPDELWIIRINPQQRGDKAPKTNASIIDRENELMGNLSLNKELDFIMFVNKWCQKHGGKFAEDKKPVTVRTIKMTKKTADALHYSSKFDRGRAFMERLRAEGKTVAQSWLNRWPRVGEYPEDAGY